MIAQEKVVCGFLISVGCMKKGRKEVKVSILGEMRNFLTPSSTRRRCLFSIGAASTALKQKREKGRNDKVNSPRFSPRSEKGGE